MKHGEHEDMDPRYQDAEYRGNPQHAELPMRKAMQGPKPRGMAMPEEAPMGPMGARKRWRPKGRR